MVVVMPALPKGQEPHPPAIAGEVWGVEIAVANGVGGRVHQPGHVINDHQAQRDCPEHQAQATPVHPGRLSVPVQAQGEGQLHQQEPTIQPAIEGIFLEIPCEPVHVLEGWDLMEHPPAVGPPQAPASIVVIVGLV